MNENLNNDLPIGAIGKIIILSENNIHYGYDLDTEIVGKVHNEEKYFVYKIIDDWHLIGNHQWILYKDKNFKFDNTEGIEEQEEIIMVEDSQEEVLIEEIITVEEEQAIEESVEETIEHVEEEVVVEETPIEEDTVVEEDSVEEEHVEKQEEKPSDNLFKKLTRIFRKR